MNSPLINNVNIIKTINLDDVIYTSAKSELDAIEKNAYKLFEQAVSDIKVIRRKYPFSIASSFGKDSTILLLAGLEAHIQLVNEGIISQDTKFHVTTIDTLVENHLMKILVSNEIDKLKEFGRLNNINMDIRVASPNLSRQWAPMFLSGLKILSTAKMNSDCSEELKINSASRIEKQLMKEYNGNIVIMLGSRVEESAARKRSLESRNQHNKTPEELIEFADKNLQERVFAPIVNMTTEEVWLLLRRAGTTPLTTPSKGLYIIPSYTNNHALLSVIYADASDGSCPVSSKRIAGDKKTAGGCGSNARHGCSLCIKPIEDKSAKLQSQSKRHGNINLNILKVRDYMMHIGSDISFRSWHTRAIDHTTGAIAAQPNVLNAKTLDHLINLLCNVTVDEIIRARSFKEKVAVGDEMLDEGYADIFTDNGMTDMEKDEFSKSYIRYAVEPMIAPMNESIAIYLSAIHARDGIKLPPYRAIYLYKTLVIDFINEVEGARYDYPTHSLDNAYQQVRREYEDKSIRSPYPNVDPSKGFNSTIPDAVMVVPEFSIDDYDFIPHTGGLDVEQAEGCTVYSRLKTTKVPFKLAKRLLPNDQLSKMTHYKNSDLVTISGFELDHPLVTTFLDKPRKKKLVHKFSKRSIKKVSRANKGYRVIERGRTSLDKPSFGLRTNETSLTQSISNEIPCLYPATNKVYEPFLSLDEKAANAYEVNENSLMDWVDYDGLDHAMKVHNDSIAIRKKWDGHIYFFSSTEPFESLMRWGVLDLNNNAKRNTMLILKRTAYFSTIGLFRLDDVKFSEFAKQTAESASFKMSDFTNTQSGAQIQADQILEMKDYRSYKAGILLSIRQDRNNNRKTLKNNQAKYLRNPVEYSLSNIESGLTRLVKNALGLLDELLEVSFSIDNNTFHPAENKQAILSTYNAFLRYVYSYTSDINSVYELMPKSVAKKVSGNIVIRTNLQNKLDDLNDELVSTIKSNVSDFIENTTKYMDTSISMVEAIAAPFEMTKVKTRYTFNDSPAAIESDIEW
ncbi:MAG: 3'-phosphoadenosine 5'-phosphosulfate sulfotransferase (PAPS reductase)/FAD synthetase [Colwellia sp.]|jgi:3'-phosphoadenosine 5'-phosphosulfate sulfotransferase (PAPS reductase)/FAD synthetase